jgi:hypothetical protein
MTYMFIHSKIHVTDEILMLRHTFNVSVLLRDRPSFSSCVVLRARFHCRLNLFSRLCNYFNDV